jgi:2-polyprenyl-3-methyl-5-hydroxy-6-metoxy-1,4-benzoquinol methylase
LHHIQHLYLDAPLGARLYVRYRVPFVNIDSIAQFLPEAGDIVDLGCGFGVLANLLATRNPNWHVTGIDLDRHRIAVARTTINDRTNIDFRVGDARTDIQSTDAVIMTDFLHHLKVPDQNALLETVYQRLRPEGSLILLEVPTRPFWRCAMSWLSDWILYPFQEKAHFRSPEEMTATLETIGFRVRVFDRPVPIFAAIGYHGVKT